MDVVAGDACVQWFSRSGLDPVAKGCVLKCSVLPKDMGTFDCSDRCEEFCGTGKKCHSAVDWSSEIKKGRPSNWSLPVEVSVEWKEPEKKRLVGALKQLPAKMQTVPIVGLFRMKKSVQLFNPASVADGKLVFYDSAFDGPFSFDQVVAHEVAHVLYEKMGPALRKSYETTLKWGQGLQPRPGQFVDQNGKESTEEDFATNVEFYLFKKEKLDATTPLASKWIEEKFGKDFKLSPDCEREDK